MSNYDRTGAAKRRPHLRRTAAVLGLALAASGLAGCMGGVPTNQTLYSEKQPVVSRTNYIFDVQTTASGVPYAEARRLDGWLDAMDLSYGDKVAIDASGITQAAREDLEQMADRRGLLLSTVAPVTEGMLAPGVARIVVTRSTAHVPDCPDWSANSDANPMNATSPNFGCAVNSNLAAMIADPEDLLRGQKGTGETVVMSSTKAIKTFREQTPTASGKLPELSSSSAGDK